MTGGLQVQAIETCKALQSLNGKISAELFDWSATGELFDLYHFIGFPNHMHKIAELVWQSGRPYVITLLCGSPRNGLGLRIKAVRRLMSSTLPNKRARDRAIGGASSIVVITDSDRNATEVIFGLEKTKIRIVPNGVADSFFSAKPDQWRKTYGDKKFVLSVGAIQRRKNQLLLAAACNRLKLPLVLLGPVLKGQITYAQQVTEAMRQNESIGGRWIQNFTNEDELMVSAYAACRVFVLLSRQETQPLSVMQAMAARKPVLLLEAAYAQDPLFRSLPRAYCADMRVVAESMERIWNKPVPTELPRDYSWNQVASRLHELYCHVMEAGGADVGGQ